MGVWKQRDPETKEFRRLGGSGKAGANGGHYTPTVTDNGDGTVTFGWSPSLAEMPKVEDQKVELPAGPVGVTPKFTVGTVITGEAGADAAVSITGSDAEPVLRFVIPQGPQGETGSQGEKGETGATGPQGPQGETGPQGTNGLSIYQANVTAGDATEITVKSADISSAGRTVTTGDHLLTLDGKIFMVNTIKTSASSSEEWTRSYTATLIVDTKGADGDTPVKGVDYWTAEDKDEIIQEVVAAMGGSIYGTVDDDNVIVISGALANGTYTLKYEDSDGNTTDIGTLTVGSGSGDSGSEEPVAGYTDLFTVDNMTLNARHSLSSGSWYSSGNAPGYLTVTLRVDALSADTETILRLRGREFASADAVVYQRDGAIAKPSDPTAAGGTYGVYFSNAPTYTDDNGDTYIKLGHVGGAFDSALAGANVVYLEFKLAAAAITTDDIPDMIITIDEPIA